MANWDLNIGTYATIICQWFLLSGHDLLLSSSQKKISKIDVKHSLN